MLGFQLLRTESFDSDDRQSPYQTKVWYTLGPLWMLLDGSGKSRRLPSCTQRVIARHERAQSFPTALPHEILYPSDFTPDESPEQIQAMEDFLSDITAATASTWRKVSIKDDWWRTAPVDETDLNQYLYYVSSSLVSYASR